MNINEVIEALKEIRERNTEPHCDGGTLEVRVQSEDGTYDSEIVCIETANDAWFIVKEPNYEDLS